MLLIEILSNGSSHDIMDSDNAQHNMIYQQIRPWQVLDDQVLKLMSLLPRELFVPEPFKKIAFSDTALTLPNQQSMLPPKLIGRMLQSLDLPHKKETILEIGTGSGYLTALLSHLAKKVYSIDIFKNLSEEAEKKINALDIHNVTLAVCDGFKGLKEFAPFDIIIMTGSTPYLPDTLKNQLAINGQLLAFIGHEPHISAILIKRGDNDSWTQVKLFESNVPQLLHTPSVNEFQF